MKKFANAHVHIKYGDPKKVEHFLEALTKTGITDVALLSLCAYPGYEKTENPVLPQSHIRDIFTLAGSVRPAVLVDGTVAGSWNLKGKNLTITRFCDTEPAILTEQARALWPDLNRITIE